jgi:nitrogen fixation/metabolism regulation signal transduction histidine kinase
MTFIHNKLFMLNNNRNINKIIENKNEEYENENLIIEDNGRGLSNEEFIKLSEPYTRKKNQKESGTGLGLNICVQILNEHGFSITAEKTQTGTKLKIKIQK